MIQYLLVYAVMQEEQCSFFRYPAFRSHNLAITTKDTWLCSTSGQACPSHPFLFALRWLETSKMGWSRMEQKQKRGCAGAKSRCVSKWLTHSNVISLWPPLCLTSTQKGRGFHIRNGAIQRAIPQSITCRCLFIKDRQIFTPRFCLMHMETCNLGIYVRQQHTLPTQILHCRILRGIILFQRKVLHHHILL